MNRHNNLGFCLLLTKKKKEEEEEEEEYSTVDRMWINCTQKDEW